MFILGLLNKKYTTNKWHLWATPMLYKCKTTNTYKKHGFGWHDDIHFLLCRTVRETAEKGVVFVSVLLHLHFLF